MSEKNIIYQVFHEEEYVGDFLQGSFSTEEKAKEYIERNPKGYRLDRLCIVDSVIDELVPPEVEPKENKS